MDSAATPISKADRSCRVSRQAVKVASRRLPSPSLVTLGELHIELGCTQIQNPSVTASHSKTAQENLYGLPANIALSSAGVSPFT